jgi:hypothetical protein
VTRPPRLLPLLAILLLACSGCASLAGGGGGGCPPSADQILDDPRLLREKADEKLREDDWPLAFRYLELLLVLHPESPETRELYPAAVRLFKRGYLRNRVGAPESPWLHYDHALMYYWLSRFFESPDVFPQEQVDLLFLGMPYDFFREFTAYAAARPRLFERWLFAATEDNGRIDSVTGGSPARR